MKNIALVTGTNSGFGYYAGMRDLNKQAELLAAAKKQGVRQHIEIVELDVTNEAHIETVQTNIVEQFGKLDLLVNNAGYSLGGMTEGVALPDWKAQMDTNLFGVIAVTKAFLPLMRAHRNGKIINISSVSGCFGFPGLAPYVTSKYALEGFTESLRFELLPHNIQVILIQPGSYHTKIWEKGLAAVSRKQAIPEYNKQMNTLYKKAEEAQAGAADPRDVSELIVQLSKKKKNEASISSWKRGTIAHFF